MNDVQVGQYVVFRYAEWPPSAYLGGVVTTIDTGMSVCYVRVDEIHPDIGEDSPWGWESSSYPVLFSYPLNNGGWRVLNTDAFFEVCASE